jgi:hypothetical protein
MATKGFFEFAKKHKAKTIDLIETFICFKMKNEVSEQALTAHPMNSNFTMINRVSGVRY